jgi:IS30 family transposase
MPLRSEVGMSEELDIRSLSVASAAKLLKVHPKTVRRHIRRGLPRVGKRIDLIVYGAWMNQQVESAKSLGEEKAGADAI